MSTNLEDLHEILGDDSLDDILDGISPDVIHTPTARMKLSELRRRRAPQSHLVVWLLGLWMIVNSTCFMVIGYSIVTAQDSMLIVFLLGLCTGVLLWEASVRLQDLRERLAG